MPGTVLLRSCSPVFAVTHAPSCHGYAANPGHAAYLLGCWGDALAVTGHRLTVAVSLPLNISAGGARSGGAWAGRVGRQGSYEPAGVVL